MTKRLELSANTIEDVNQYFQTRARQLLSDKYFWNKDVTEFPGGYETTFIQENSDEELKTFYIVPQHRGKGFDIAYLNNLKHKIITVPDSHIEKYLKLHNVPHIIAGIFSSSNEYRLIESFYGNKKANRSKRFLMNHIDEGLAIMTHYNASEEAKKAFCIHPIIQNDADLKANWQWITNEVSPEVLGLAMEYRNIANAYLSNRTIESLHDIALSPLDEVNIMLKADKIQNYKDFLKYHLETHERSKELAHYFNNWLQKLHITSKDFTNFDFILNSIEMNELY